jgi:hypothetical protein
MRLLIRFLLPLIGYLCTATVLTGAIGYGYLRRSGKLNDESTFRVMALLHGVDLKEIEATKKEVAAGTPGEEPSFDEHQQSYRSASLQFDAKQKQLADSLTDFDYQLKRLNDETNKYASLRQDVEQYLKQQSELVTTGQLKKVREQIEALTPRKQAKPILIKMIQAGRTDEVILLLGSMKTQSQKEILKTFDTEEDTEILYRVQEKMLAGEPTLPYITERLKELEQLKEQEK